MTITIVLKTMDVPEPPTGSVAVVRDYENVSKITPNGDLLTLTFTDSSSTTVSRAYYSVMVRR